MAIEEKIVSFEKLSRYDQQIKAYIDYELSQIETGADTSDATATADKVFLDETFYAGGQKHTGTFTIQSELDSQDELIASIRSALAGKTAGSGNTVFVESLQRDGIGYIDTGIDGANSNLKIEIRYEFNTMPTGYWNLVYAYSSETADCTRILYNKHNYVITSLNSVASSSISHSAVRYTNVVYTDILKPTSSTAFSYTQNGVSPAAKTRTSGTALTGKNLLLFAASTANDSVSIKVYYLKIYDGNTLVRDFIPYVNYNGEVGMFDRVEQKFYGNKGGGEFKGVIRDEV